MRLVVQRVSRAKVTVDHEVVDEIGRGVVVLVGIAPDDGPQQVSWGAEKIAGLRIFPDDEDKMNLSLSDIGGEALIVSQFTLYGDARKGKRPSFIRAASGPEAEAVYRSLIAALTAAGIECASGTFGAMMQVSLTNDGPVTILLDSERTF